MDISEDVQNAYIDVVEPLVIGKHVNSSYPDYFNGLIDDLRIYNRALSEAEIEELYNMSINLNNALVAHYEFEDNADDSSGNNNNGTEYGDVTYTDGIIGKAAKFDGKNNYITINNTLKSDNNFTISIWSNLENIDNNQRVITFGQDTDNFIEITYDWVVDKIYFTKKQDGSYTRTEITNPITYDKWLHFIVIKLDNEYKLYFDSTYKVSQTISLADIDFLKLCRNFEDESAATGLIDDLRIYNRPINNIEIQELYKLGTK